MMQHTCDNAKMREMQPVIELNTKSQRLFGTGRPLQNFLGPIHTKEAMHLALDHHLPLGSVPKRIVCLGLLQFLIRVNEFTLILGVQKQGFFSPREGAVHRVVAGTVPAHR